MKASRTSNRNSQKFVNELKPFIASNLEGRWINNKYVVISYGWYPIYIFSNQDWFRNENGYSPSTKRQMMNARPETFSFIDISDKAMKKIMGAV